MPLSQGLFCIGLYAIMTLVSLACVLLIILEKIPVLLLLVAESQTGEIDILLQPAVLDGSAFINASEVAERLAGLDDVLGLAPRWIMSGTLSQR